LEVYLWSRLTGLAFGEYFGSVWVIDGRLGRTGKRRFRVTEFEKFSIPSLDYFYRAGIPSTFT